MLSSFASTLHAMQFPIANQITDAEFAVIRKLIYREAGISFNDSKRALVCSRLAKRLRTLGLSSYAEYLDYLKYRDPDGDELQQMIDCLTTNKTDFFREPHHFEFLRKVVFPEAVKRAAAGKPRRLRIWSAACSMGHEPYSIAMEALEYPDFGDDWDIRILASDISTRALQIAQQGVYSLDQLAPIAVGRRNKYFTDVWDVQPGQYAVCPDVKRMVTFRQINLMDDSWPMNASFDVIFCRNVIIYFDQATQQRLLNRLADQLTKGGYLLLGHSESPHWLNETLSPLGHTIYQRPIKGGAAKPPRPFVPQQCPTPTIAGHRLMIHHVSEDDDSPVLPRQPIMAGEVCASPCPLEIRTVLGSCVAACLFDPVAHVGGMNHFMLPGIASSQDASARYGIHAMELLINAIMKFGGDRRRLQAKAFGGANVLGFSRSQKQVGSLNVDFIRRFLKTERIPLIAERLGGDQPLQVHFHTATGRAFIRPVLATNSLLQSEQGLERRVADQLKHPSPDNITLF